MMYPNPLFAFLADKTGFENVLDEKEDKPVLLPQKVKREDDYVMYKLDTSNQPSIEINKEEYTITEHHLSFYKTLNDEKYWVSQYHYTAIATHKLGYTRKIHIYLDRADKLKKVILLDEATGNKIILDEESSANLAESARSLSKAIMIKLRHLAQQYYGTLETDYEQLEKSLTILSESLAKNRQLYLAELDKAISKLRLLQFHHAQYETLHRYFMDVQQAQSASPKSVLPSVKEDTIIEVKSGTVVAATPASVEPVQSVNLFQIKLNEALAARAAFTQAKDEKAPLQTRAILAEKFFQKCNETMLENLELQDNPPPSFKDLVSLQRLSSESLREGKRLLESTIIDKNGLSAAEHLKSFVPFISPKCVKIFFMQDNAPSLQFFLSNGQVALDTYTIDGNPLVTYCFLNHSSEKPKVQCMKILIAMGVSLYISAPDGLPILHHIFMEKSGDLFKALFENDNALLNKSKVYSYLERAMKKCVVSLELSDSEKLKPYIDIYHRSASSINSAPTFRHTTAILNRLAEGTRMSIHRVNQSQVIIESEDKDYIENKQTIDALINQIESLSADINKSNVRLTLDDTISIFTKMVEEMVSPSDHSTSEVLKKRKYDFQNFYIELLQFKLEAHQLLCTYGDKPLSSSDAVRYKKLRKQVFERIDWLQDIHHSSAYSEKGQESLNDIKNIALAVQRTLDEIMLHNRFIKKSKIKKSDAKKLERERKEELNYIIENLHPIGADLAQDVMISLGKPILFKNDPSQLELLKVMEWIPRKGLFDLILRIHTDPASFEKEVNIKGKLFIIKVTEKNPANGSREFYAVPASHAQSVSLSPSIIQQEVNKVIARFGSKQF